MTTPSGRGPAADGDRQARLDDLFGAEAAFWRDLYAARDVLALIHRHRTALTLAWIDELGLPPGARVLEVGCGAGLLAIELARRGLEVDATDPVPAMLDLARDAIHEAGVADRVTVATADVHELAFGDGAFALVVALGVLPWIDDWDAALGEVARVLAPGGRFVASSNAPTPLHVLADPSRLPLLAPLRDAARRVVRRVRPRAGRPPARPVSFARPAALVDRLDAVGLDLVRSQGFGFGPFTFLGRPVLPDRIGRRLETRLQRRAAGGDRLLDALAAQHLFLAERRPG